MPSPVAVALAAALLLTTAVAPFAAERKVALAVDNMTCASCAFIVGRALERVEGVGAVELSLREGKAVVTFDDARTDLATLTAATAAYGYPARPLAEEAR